MGAQLIESIEYVRRLITEMVEEFTGDVAVGETFSFVYNDQRFEGRIYERFNGHMVVLFEVKIGVTKLTRHKQDLINRLNGQLPFTTFRLQKASGGQHSISAVHSLSVDGVEADQLVQTLESIVYQVVEQRSVLMQASDTTRRVQDVLNVDSRDRRSTSEHISDSVDDDIDGGAVRDTSSARRARTPNVRVSTTDTASILADLRRLVGLEPVKIEVERLVAAREFTNARVARGLPAIEQSPHLVFTGNPGTGKTTVARMVADLYKALGILNKGHVVEADCSKLIAAYIGQTPIKTQRLCEEARGGVLFIDEAYGLTAHQHQGYGPEAIETLLKFMEDNRGDIVVIVAGYPQEMQGFLDANPGLRSRFDVVIDFPDYSTDELVSIFDLYLDEFELQLTSAAREKLIAYTAGMERRRGFGNGRAMRNLFNDVVRRHAVWVARNGAIAERDLTLISAEVVPDVPGVNQSSELVGHGAAYL